ncbi:DNA repair protein RecO [Candidatus Saccharibacteria bacterium]|nr:DNA repair protein RecO [Candidatus Saccharibacteria bacterium]
MYKSTQEIKTSGYVVGRTNYGEADRILRIITPVGKVSAIAKGVRKPKSKLAGGIELLTLSDLVIHRGRSELGIVTSAKMRKYHDGILASYKKMELAGEMMKKIDRAAENTETGEFFRIMDECFDALDVVSNTEIVEAWFELNLLKAMGEEINLYRDNNGERLEIEKRYEWDAMEKSFVLKEKGRYGADEIKILRLMVSSPLRVVMRVKGIETKMEEIMWIVKVMVK